ncbi:hypothetical protein, partial [Chromobacterium phragmitis]
SLLPNPSFYMSLSPHCLQFSSYRIDKKVSSQRLIAQSPPLDCIQAFETNIGGPLNRIAAFS